jgi:hypothetical protein
LLPLQLQMPGRKSSYLKRKILGARSRLADCGIPESAIQGFRAPFLDSDPAMRRLLHSSGFLYDSSLIEDSTWSVSKGFEARLWPFDMAGGIPINCSM